MSLIPLLYALTILLGCSIGLVVGLYLSWLRARVSELGQAVVALSKRKADVPIKEEPKAFIADPDDLAQRLKFERDQAREALNK